MIGVYIFSSEESTQYRGSAFVCNFNPQVFGCMRIQLFISGNSPIYVPTDEPTIDFYPDLSGPWYKRLKVVSI